MTPPTGKRRPHSDARRERCDIEAARMREANRGQVQGRKRSAS